MSSAPPLHLTAECWIQSPHRAFGLVRSPAFTVHDDFNDSFDQALCKKQNAYLDRNASVLMARPTPLVLDTKFGAAPFGWTMDTSGGATNAWHDDVLSGDTGKRCLLMDDSNSGVLARAYSTFVRSATDAFFVKVMKGAAPVDAPHDGAHCYWILNLGFDASVAASYRICARMGQPFTLEISTDGGATYNVLRATDTIPDSEVYLQQNDRSAFITFLPILQENTVSVYIGDGDGDLSFSPPGGTFPSDALHFESQNGKVRLEYFPAGFPTAWSLTSAAKETGFTPRTLPTGRVWPDGVQHAATRSTPRILPYPSVAEGACTVGIAVAPDPDIPVLFRYQITGANPYYPSFPAGYARVSAAVKYAQIDWPVLTYNDTFDVPIPLNIRRVSERHVLDWNNLNVVAQASITCDNYHGQWSYSSGLRAFQLSRGWNGDNQIGMTGWIGETIQFTRADPTREVTFQAFDRSFPMRRKKCGILPFLDGWCIYAAMRFLASVAGVTPDWLIYLPFCLPGPCPAGCTHPLLPVGTGTRPRWRPNPQATIWTEMNRIRQAYRHILGFDRIGFLVFEPFDVTTLRFFGDFGVRPQFASGTALLNEIVGQITTTASVADVRSDVTFGGINPGDNWTPQIVHIEDDSIVFDPSNPAFLGFYDSWVEIDPIFTSRQFMVDFATLMKQQTGLPTVDTSFRSHLQPYMGLLDIFSVTEPITVGSADFYAALLSHNYSVGDSQFDGTTDINGKATFNLFG